MFSLISTISVLITAIYGIYSYDCKQILNNKYLSKIVFIISVFFLLVTIIKKTTLNPKLNECIFPCNTLIEKYPKKYDIILKMHIPKQSAIIYWGPKTTENNNGIETYNTKNNGIAIANDKGEVIIKIKIYNGYYKKSKIFKPKYIPFKIFYRICENDTLSKIRDIIIKDDNKIR
jgi:hypothetical protein